MAYSGSITFLRGARKKRVPVFRVQSLSALQTFAGQIATLSATGLHRCAISEVADFTNTEPQTTSYVGYYAVFRLKNAAPEEGENPWREVHVPDPLTTLFELTGQEQVLTVKATVGAQVATWYSAVSGATYTFEKGWLWKG